MKKILIIPLGILIIFILSVTILISFNERIVRGNFNDTLKIIVISFFPPKDLYTPLVNEKLDISQKNFSIQKKIKHKYPGRYRIGVLLDNLPIDLLFHKEKYNFNAIVEINFSVNGKQIKSYFLKSDYLPILTKEKSGLFFYCYSCPKDLPLDKLVTITAQVVPTPLHRQWK